MAITIENKVKEFSDMLVLEAARNAECFPIDRYFLNPYLEKILSMNRNAFLIYNLERLNNNYSVQLLLCLPELWKDITVKDLIEIVSNFTNSFSYYALILFTYKYIEINIIEIIFRLDILDSSIKTDIKIFLKTQYPNLLKTQGEIYVIDENLIGVKNEEWMYIKQILLCDKRIEPALSSIDELQEYVNKLCV